MAGILNFLNSSKPENVINDSSHKTTSGNILNKSKNRNVNLENTNVTNVINDFSNKTVSGTIDNSTKVTINIESSTKTYQSIAKGVKENIKFITKPVSSFMGRERELDEVHSKLKVVSAETVISKTVAIVGLGGIGKTELSKKYADQYKDQYEHRIFINSETRKNSIESFKRLYCIITKTIDDKEKEAQYYVDQVYNYIGTSDRTLLVFDNVEHFKDIVDFMPTHFVGTHDISVLINSRYRKWDVNEWGDIEVVELKGFSQKEAELYVKKQLRIEEDDEDVLKLVEKLQAFPLGLKHAVGYINNQNKNLEMLKKDDSRVKIKDYLIEMDKDRPKKLFYEIDCEYDMYGKTIYNTWDITINKLSKHPEHGLHAENMLNILAYFEPIISTDMFLSSYTKFIIASDCVDDDNMSLEHIESALLSLQAYSMVDIEDGHNMQNKKITNVAVHRLVQHIVRDTLKASKLEEKVLEAALYVVNFLSSPFDSELNLHVASVWSYAVSYENLLKNNYSVVKYGLYGSSPLHLFAASHNKALDTIMKWKDIEVNCLDYSGRTPLYAAIRSGYVKVVEFLLNKGADANFIPSFLRLSHLKHYHIVNKYSNEIQQELVFNIGQNVQENFCITDENDIVEYVLFESDDCVLIDSKLFDRSCYLFLDDLITKNKETWKILKAKGQHRKNSIRSVRFSNVRFKCDRGEICLRLKNKIESKCSNELNKPRMLNLATFEGHLNLVKYFIKIGENPTDFDEDGETAVHAAVRQNHINIVKYFIEEMNIDVDIKNCKGETPLHRAAEFWWLDLAKYLVSQGADINAEDDLGLTPIFSTVHARRWMSKERNVFQYFLKLEAKQTCGSNSLLGKLGIDLRKFTMLCNQFNAFQTLEIEKELDIDVKHVGKKYFDSYENRTNLIIKSLERSLNLNLPPESIKLSTLDVEKNLLTNVWSYDKKTYKSEQNSKQLKVIKDNLEKFTNLEYGRYLRKLLNYVWKHKNVSSLFTNQNFNDVADEKIKFKFTSEPGFTSKSDSEYESEYHGYEHELTPNSNYHYERCCSDTDSDDGHEPKSESESLHLDFMNCSSVMLDHEPAAPISGFVGRESTLKKMQDCLQNDRKMAIFGAAGIGKTELCKKYAQLYKEHYNEVLWMDATTRCGIFSIFQRLSRQNKLLKKRYFIQTIKTVHRHFNSNGKTLYIFDNAESFEQIEHFLPKCDRSHVLINSRNVFSCENFEIAELKDFTREEAVEYVKKQIRILQNDERVADLINVLGRCPLVLKQAVGYIKQKYLTKSEFKIQNYLEVFDDYRTKIEISSFESDSYDKVCYVTWRIIFDDVQDRMKDVENFKYLIYLLYKTDSTLENISTQQQENFSLIKTYTSIKAFVDMTKLHFVEQNQEEAILKDLLKLLRETFSKDFLESSKEKDISVKLGNFIILTYDVWLRVMSYSRLTKKLSKKKYCENVFIPIGTSIINWNRAMLSKLLELTKCGKFQNFERDMKKSILLSARHGFLDGIEQLVHFGANINSKDNQHAISHIAAANGYRNIMLYLGEHARHLLKVRDWNGTTPEILASYFGHVDIVQILTQDKRLLLMAKLYSVLDDNDEKCIISTVERFKTEHPNFDISSIFNVPVLSTFLIEDDNSFVKFKPRDSVQSYLNIVFDRPYTLLHSAAVNGHLEAVKSLVENKHNEYEVDVNGNTALHYAALNGHVQVVQFFVDELKMEVNFRNFMGSTPLHLAALTDNIEIVTFLVEKGGDVNVEDDLGADPELYAAFGNNADIVQFFLDRKSTRNTFSRIFGFVSDALKIKSRDESPASLLRDLGITSLHVAAIFDNLNIAKMLIDTNGINHYKCNEIGMFHCFDAFFKNEEVFPFLIDVGVVNVIVSFEVDDFIRNFKLDPKYAALMFNLKFNLLSVVNILKLQKGKSERFLNTLKTIESCIKNIS